MSAAPHENGITAQYPAIKRKRPQQKKEKTEKEVKSNPSKRHRDRLNIEIDNISQLIPFPQEVLEKLDKLSILRLAVSYLRNKSYYSAEESTCGFVNELGTLTSRNQQMQVDCVDKPESKLALEALHGFLLVVTQDFNVLYVSETIQSYLGYPQSDVMNQSILDLIHAEDREIFMRHLQINASQTPGPAPEEGQPPIVPEYTNLGMTPAVFRGFSRDGLFHRSFICRMRCLLDNSSGFLALHFTGHLRLVPGQNKKSEQKVQLPPEMGLFVLASPLQSPSILEIRTKNLIFRTKHRLDYTPLGIDAKGKIVLGYTEQQMRQRSGYEFVHSADMMHCADAHTKLMRLGESGLIAFRLLHKENRWIWVTASARLIFRDGRPDFIIATQRPIMDQEGEEHMKKRTNAFRFDFTGQAILYGEVNPIGTRGGPEKNPLNESSHEEPMAKRQRTSLHNTNTNEIDRKSLYGAQSMQRLDIYAGSIPHQPTDLYAKPESIDPNVDPNIAFYPIGSSAQQPPMQEAMANCQSSNGYHTANINTMTQGGDMMANHTPPFPNLHHQMSQESHTSSEYPSPRVMQTEQQSMYHTPSQPIMQGINGNIKSNPLKRPFPGKHNVAELPQSTMFGPSQRIACTGKVMPPTTTNHTMRQHNNSVAGHHMQFANPHGQVAMPMQQRPDQQFSNYVPSQQQNLLQPHGQQPSVIESMTINSFVNPQDPASDMNSYPMSFNDAHLPVPDQYGETPLIAMQDNTIQFDLQKVATDYQTTDPLSKVQEYLHNNPSHAMAIATGQLPEAGMPRLQANEITALMLDYQGQPHEMQRQDMLMSRQRMASNNSIGKSINSSCSSLNQPYNMSDDDVNQQMTLSISSVESYAATNNQNLEGALGEYFNPPEGFLQS